MTHEEVWQLVQSSESALRRECRRYLPSARMSELDEMYSDVVLSRAIAIMNTYDAAKGAGPRHHLISNVRWYAYKWVNREAKIRRRHGADVDDHDPGYVDSQDNSLRVETILNKVPDEYAQVLRWRYMNGYTPEEIAQHLDVSRDEVKRMCREGLRAARGER